MGNVNTIVEKVNGKKLLRELFILNGFFTFLFLVKPGSIVSGFIAMLLGFFYCLLTDSREGCTRLNACMAFFV